MIKMIMMVLVLTINDFCFCTHLESSCLYFQGKGGESRQTYFKLGFYQKATREEDKHCPKGPFHFPFPQPQAQLERKAYSTVTQWIQKLKCFSFGVFLERRACFFNRSHILHVGFSSLLAMPSLSFFPCYVPLQRFFLTESSCIETQRRARHALPFYCATFPLLSFLKRTL